jgi:pyruvate,orthophosphate dikinase
MEGIPDEWGTAVSVMAMVFGNMGDTSATGVCFSRDAATGENLFNGEYLVNAQGEDVVAGIRTPQQITIEGSKRWAALAGVSEEERKASWEKIKQEEKKGKEDSNRYLPEAFEEARTLIDKAEERKGYKK